MERYQKLHTYCCVKSYYKYFINHHKLCIHLVALEKVEIIDVCHKCQSTHEMCSSGYFGSPWPNKGKYTVYLACIFIMFYTAWQTCVLNLLKWLGWNIQHQNCQNTWNIKHFQSQDRTQDWYQIREKTSTNWLIFWNTGKTFCYRDEI